MPKAGDKRSRAELRFKAMEKSTRAKVYCFFFLSSDEDDSQSRAEHEQLHVQSVYSRARFASVGCGSSWGAGLSTNKEDEDEGAAKEESEESEEANND